ncbi:MAG: winged helix-turn-helix transcriptional regulator [Lachnospiraceae bacterium]|nr:winged helix-turn-helix transcriptional regulator [Lachnospiraceae bacterium]
MHENYIKNSHYEEDDVLLTSESELIIRRFLTKQMVQILLLLLNYSMTNKEMAEKMRLSSSALSNILQRMKKCEIELLVMEKKEKYILYSLTPIAKEYTEKFLVVKEKKDLKVIQIHENETIQLINCRNALRKLKDKLGKEWEADFSYWCFRYYENGERGKMPEVDSFFETLEDLIINEQFSQFESIMDELEDEVSRKNCLRYINKYIGIRRLCFLDEDDWKTAYQFIDDIFRGEEMCISCSFLEKSGDLTKEDIIKMSNGIFEIVNCSLKKKMTKGEFLDTWSKYFISHEKLAYYIADKYRNKYLNR